MAILPAQAGQVEMVSMPVCLCREKSSKACWLVFSLASYTSLSRSSRRTIQWSLKGDPSCAMLVFYQAGKAKPYVLMKIFSDDVEQTFCFSSSLRTELHLKSG